MKRLALSAAALSCLLLAQCRRAAPAPAPVDPLTLLPPETQRGLGTMGCLINGKAYATGDGPRAEGDWLTASELSIGGSIYEDGDALKNRSTISIRLNGQFTRDGTGNYTLIPNVGSYPLFSGIGYEYIASAYLNNAYFSGKYVRRGQVELLKFDGVARIASGRFAFTLYEPGRPDTLHVTNGRFDLKFY